MNTCLAEDFSRNLRLTWCLQIFFGARALPPWSVLILNFIAGLTLMSAQEAWADNFADYTNFGLDLKAPIFPKGGVLNLYKNQSDKVPFHVIRGKAVLQLDDDWKSCVTPKAGSAWVRCSADAITGWVKRAEFISGGEYSPTNDWPFRYWLYRASDTSAGEVYDVMQTTSKKSPYLVVPAEYENIFFKVTFDKNGFALSPKTGKLTGDRIFTVGQSVYLAPADDKKRDGSTWLFLNFYHPKLVALCPSLNPDSCFSAVNLSDDWKGIRALNTEPPPPYVFDEAHQRKETLPWYGVQQVAFARFRDPVKPLMYTVPDWVYIRGEAGALSDAQLKKNRLKQFCLMDCASNKPITKAR